jgi:hypothetical protein
MWATCVRILNNLLGRGYQRSGAYLSTMIQQVPRASSEGFIGVFTNSQPLLRLLII